MARKFPDGVGLGLPKSQRDEVLPEPHLEGVILIRGPKGLEIKVRNPKRVLEILNTHPGSRVVKK